MKILIVFDFDHTVVDDNTDTHIMTLGEDGKIPDSITSSYQSGHWTAFMNTVFEYLFKDCKISKAQYEHNLSKLPLTNGFLALFELIRSNEMLDCVILSDSNSWFIDFILSKYKIRDVPLKIFTNNANFEAGCLKITPCHDHQHDSCPINLCKGTVLQQFIDVENATGNRYDRIFYVGDGGNDLCPATRLKDGDILFARNGYGLHKKLIKLKNKDVALNDDELSCTVHIWDDGMKILHIVEEFLQQKLS